MIWMNGDRHLTNGMSVIPSVIISEEPIRMELNNQQKERALILYSPDNELSVKLKDNTEIVLKHQQIQFEALELDRTESISYSDYDIVILASSFWQDMQDNMTRLSDYVEEGGRLLLESLPQELESQFASVYRSFGIVEYSDYIECDTLDFQQELIPGIGGMSFSGEEFNDVSLAVGIENSAEIYAYACGAERKTPYIWNYKYGEGSVTFYNGTAISGDFWRGIIAGCVNSLYDTIMYPMINANCIFVDDFPSPQYESTSDVVRKEYNRSVKEFYRDIWWPDMQQIAERYGDIYTCLFVATYNDIVDPKKFSYVETSMEQYYGNSLLRKGFEMGAHGYNHQSLTLAGGTPESFHYKPWKDINDMKASLNKLTEIAGELFPTVSFKTYVPPSNYLSQEGRDAVKQVFPELKTISGIYTKEGEEGEVYVQDFVMAEDGVAEFPRISAGMLPTDFDRFAIVNGMGVYGVFSHFIHPDDIFDKDRGQNQTWENMIASYGEMIEWVHVTWPFLRSLTGSEAADALKVCVEAETDITYKDSMVCGKIDFFYGDMYFYLKTAKLPVSVDDSCTIRKVSESDKGYYIVTVLEPEFKIKLVEK